MNKGLLPKSLEENVSCISLISQELKIIQDKIVKTEALIISILLHECGTIPMHEAVEGYSIMDEYLEKLFKFEDEPDTEFK